MPKSIAATGSVRDQEAVFRRWCLGFSGCEGGDLGRPQHPAIWVCGIEPGGPHAVDAHALAMHIAQADVAQPALGYDDWRENLSGSFRRRIAKLLTALHGEPVADYRRFAEQYRPFTQGSHGFCRLNLYPVGFADTDLARWDASFAQLSGFARKADYLAWCDQHRLPAMRRWARASRPRLVVGLGKSYAAQFCAAFLDPDTAITQENMVGKSLSWGVNHDSSMLAIVPFLTSPSGLQADATIQAFGLRLRELLASIQNPKLY